MARYTVYSEESPWGPGYMVYREDGEKKEAIRCRSRMSDALELAHTLAQKERAGDLEPVLIEVFEV